LCLIAITEAEIKVAQSQRLQGHFTKITTEKCAAVGQMIGNKCEILVDSLMLRI